MTGTVQTLLGEIRCALERLYDGWLRGVYLYGSYARGEEELDSDVDLLIVLDVIENYGAEIHQTSELISSSALRYGRSISRVFVTERSWRESPNSFLSRVRHEAIAA